MVCRDLEESDESMPMLVSVDESDVLMVHLTPCERYLVQSFQMHGLPSSFFTSGPDGISGVHVLRGHVVVLNYNKLQKQEQISNNKLILKWTMG